MRNMTFKAAAIACVMLVSLSAVSCSNQTDRPDVVNSDIERFWEMYDAVQAVVSEDEKLSLINELYIDKGTPGLEKLIRARRYTDEEYLTAISSYPEFWASIRPHTKTALTVASDLSGEIELLRTVYPELKPSKIYFAIGALRTNGTILEGDLLIGAELAFATPGVVSTELSSDLPHLPAYFATNPKANIGSLVLHEYVHTQQIPEGGYNLLAQALYEGVAEYVATKAIGRDSSAQSIRFGLENDERLKDHFSKEMFSPWFVNWLWNSPDNQYGVRDLAYYIGYAIADAYVEQADDRSLAIKRLIELDYQDEAAVEQIVEQSGYFDSPLETLRADFERRRPTITEVRFGNDSQGAVPPDVSTMTLVFSEPMNTCCASADFGPLGAEHYPKLSGLEWSEDGREVTYSISLESDTRYQMQIQSNYRSPRGLPLIPKLVEFQTSE